MRGSAAVGEVAWAGRPAHFPAGRAASAAGAGAAGATAQAWLLVAGPAVWRGSGVVAGAAGPRARPIPAGPRGSGSAAGSGFGSGLFNLNGAVRLTNVTIARNTVAAGTTSNGAIVGQAAGSAVYNLSLTVSAYPGGPSATATQTATVTIANSILAYTASESVLAN